MSDERVKIAADAMWDADEPIAVEFAEAILAALEAAGYTIAKLVWWSDVAEEPDGHAFSVYRIEGTTP